MACQRATTVADMSRMTEDGCKAKSYLFSASLGGDVFARVGLNEKQVVKNRLYRGALMKITRAYVRNMADIVEARELTVSAVQEE